MKALKPADFPELRRVFSGYLHEDVIQEHGTPAAALRAFCQDADADERRRFRTEVLRLLTHIDGVALHDVRALMTALGSRWVPPSRKALVALFTDVAMSAK